MIYRAKLKSRREMERDIPRAELGWWHDVCPGQTLEVRDATADDLARCSLREGSSRDPADYLCENFESGSLVARKAVAHLEPWTEEQMGDAVRKAIARLGPERFARALGAFWCEGTQKWLYKDESRSAFKNRPLDPQPPAPEDHEREHAERHRA